MYTAVLCLLIAAPLAVLAEPGCMIAPPAQSYARSGESGMAVSGAASSGVPSGVSENQLYQAVLPFDQYAQGYGTGAGDTGVQRVDNQPQELPEQTENQPGQDQTMDHTLPDEQREGQVNLNKEIHNYVVQRKTININNRILHRYLKNLLVRTIYNTNIAKINHQKLINQIITTLQETHQPKLLVKYTREDKTNDKGERNEQPEVSEEKKDNVLPPIFEPATAEKIGYDGNALGPAVSAGGSVGGGSTYSSGGSSSSGSSFSSGGSSSAGSGSFGGGTSGSGSSNYGGSMSSGSGSGSLGSSNYGQSGGASSAGGSSNGMSGYSGKLSGSSYMSAGGASQLSGSHSFGSSQ